MNRRGFLKTWFQSAACLPLMPAGACVLDRGEFLSTRIVKLEQVKSSWERVRFEVVPYG